MYITKYLVDNAETIERVCISIKRSLNFLFFKVKELLERVEFVIVPYVNPDGYTVRSYYLIIVIVLMNTV